MCGLDRTLKNWQEVPATRRQSRTVATPTGWGLFRVFRRKMKLTKSETRKTVWNKTAGCCWYCGIQTNPWEDFCIDHLISKRNGGKDEISNLMPCCNRCNIAKGNLSLDVFRAWLSSHQRYRVVFSSAQIALLKSHGINTETFNLLKPYIFFFERQK